ncbi:aminoacyl--tRNA ligase-related protein [Pseudovibrio denitrificans]|uniref:aminoacyl--tRNA ligase-related protein n=1 Tax=Pseudovibrio denitrificans TaxID=258256 RepID=UPI0039BFA94C
MIMSTLYKVTEGLATLGPEALKISKQLDSVFVFWAQEVNAVPMLFPPLLKISDLDRFDYFKNFPHLANLATTIDETKLPSYSNSDCSCGIPVSQLSDSEYAMAPAACYPIYLQLRDKQLKEPKYYTTSATCYRNEREYNELKRLRAFTMREIVCVGDHGSVIAHLQSFTSKVKEFSTSLDLAIGVEAASDPFFQPENASEDQKARLLMSQLFPTKEEFLFEGSVAIGSANFHRNFFGERCNIRMSDNKIAYTGCVAFGIERWLHALLKVHNEDVDLICSKIASSLSEMKEKQLRVRI